VAAHTEKLSDDGVFGVHQFADQLFRAARISSPPSFGFGISQGVLQVQDAGVASEFVHGFSSSGFPKHPVTQVLQ